MDIIQMEFGFLFSGRQMRENRPATSFSFHSEKSTYQWPFLSNESNTMLNIFSVSLTHTRINACYIFTAALCLLYILVERHMKHSPSLYLHFHSPLIKFVFFYFISSIHAPYQFNILLVAPKCFCHIQIKYLFLSTHCRPMMTSSLY